MTGSNHFATQTLAVLTGHYTIQQELRNTAIIPSKHNNKHSIKHKVYHFIKEHL